MKRNEYIETKPRGSKDLPIQLYRVDPSHPEYVMPLHWHRELEIIRVMEGSLTLYLNNCPYNLYPGDIAFVNCKILHRGEPTDCKYDCLVLDLSLVNKKGNSTVSSYIEPIIDGELYIQTLLHFDNSKLYETVNSLFTILSQNEENFELSVIGNLYIMLHRLYSDGLVGKHSKKGKSTGQTAAISKLVNWIDNNYSENITLSLLAEKAGMTPNYLCRVFKEYTGKTPIEYINFARIEGVCLEIDQGQKNITLAATNNGFNDLSYFCKVFKKIKGVSAKTYAGGKRNNG